MKSELEKIKELRDGYVSKSGTDGASSTVNEKDKITAIRDAYVSGTATPKGNSAIDLIPGVAEESPQTVKTVSDRKTSGEARAEAKFNADYAKTDKAKADAYQSAKNTKRGYVLDAVLSAMKGDNAAAAENVAGATAAHAEAKKNESAYKNYYGGLDELRKEYNGIKGDLDRDMSAEERATATAKMDELRARAKGKYGVDISSTAVGDTVGGATRQMAGGFVNAAGNVLDLLVPDKGTPIVNNQMVNFTPTRESTLADEAQGAAEKMYSAADTLSEKGNTKIENAKVGKSGASQVLIDIGAAAVPVAADIVANTVLPGSGLAAMGVRAYGSGAQEARQAGASVGQAAAYGAATAAVELLTEKLSSGLNLAYGKGAADNITDYVVGELASTTAGQKAWKLLFSSLGEGAEEAISDLVNPLTKAIYTGKVDYSQLEASEVLYDAFIGAVIGFFGDAASIGTNATPTEQYFRDAAQQGKTFKEACKEYAAETATSPTAETAEVAENAQAPQNVSESGAEQTHINTAPTEVNADTADAVELNTAEGTKATPDAGKIAYKVKPVARQTVINADMENTAQTAKPASPAKETPLKADINESGEGKTRTEYAPTADAISIPADSEGKQTGEAMPNVATDEQGFTGKTAETQNTQFEQMGEDGTWHVVHADAEVGARADAMMAGKSSAQIASELTANEVWSDVDTNAAGKLSARLVDEAKNAATEAERTAIREQLADFRKVLESRVRGMAQGLRQRRIAFSPAEVEAKATETLYGEQSNTRKLPTGAKESIINNSGEMAQRLVAIPNGDTAAVVGLIHELSSIRRTSGLSRKADGAMLSKRLDKIAKMDGGFEFLKSIAERQIYSVASDYVKPGIINSVKSFRYLSMLSGFTTKFSNIGANTVLGNVISVSDNNAALVLDMLFSAFDGKRQFAFDRGMASKAWWKGMDEASLKSSVEVMLDVSEVDSKYKGEGRQGRTYKMTGNWLERFLSQLEAHQSLTMNTTDQMQKGGTRAEVERGLTALNESRAKKGKSTMTAEEITQRGADEALERTLQNKTELSEGLGKVRSALDFIGNKETGRTGIGTGVMPFLTVGVNSQISNINHNPVGGASKIAYNVGKAIYDLAKGKKISDSTRLALCKSVGQFATGATMCALGMVASAAGIVRTADEDDKDATALEKAIGFTGTQFNISAFARMLMGEGVSFEDDDMWLSTGWMPQLNGCLTVGAALHDAYKDDGRLTLREISSASIEGILDGAKDFPALSSITSLCNAWKYSEAEDAVGKLYDVGVEYIGNSMSSYVPNLLAQISQGLDTTERDLYNTDSVGQEFINKLIAKTPWRNTLPEKVDNFGNTIVDEDAALHFLNKTMFPAKATTDKNDRVYKAVLEIYKATDNASVIPDKSAPNSITYDGRTVGLTAEQKTQYQKTAGQIYYDAVNRFIDSQEYKSLSKAGRAEYLAEAYSYAKDTAKMEALERNSTNYKSSWQNTRKVVESGVDVIDYLIGKDGAKATHGSADGFDSVDVYTWLKDSKYTDKQKESIIDAVLNLKSNDWDYLEATAQETLKKEKSKKK